jgi:hypothetical protein
VLGEIGESTKKFQEPSLRWERERPPTFRVNPYMKPLHSRTRALQRRAAGVRPMIHPSHRTHSTSLCFSSRRIPGNLLRNSQGLRSTQRYQTSSPNQLNLFNQHQKEPTERLPQGSRLSWVTRVSDWPMVRCQTHGLSKKCGRASPILCMPYAILCSFVQFLSPNLRRS